MSMSEAAEPRRVCGIAAVQALARKRPATILRLFHTEARREVAYPIAALLARAKKPYREVSAEELARVAGTPHHGGIVAIALPRIVANLPWPLPAGLDAAPVLPVLDGIGNPHNLGAIARSACFLGARALLLSGEQRQAGLSDAAIRTAEGALEWLDLWRAPVLAETLRGMAARFAIVAAVAEGGVAPEEIARGRPIALVLGHEEHGVSPPVLAACTARVTLPARGPVQSLNVSVAAALLIERLSR
jgi:RNA methyltransferase, TrmH family